MSESSWFWGSTTPGDAGPYTDDEFSDLVRKIFQADRATQGPLTGIGSELAVSGTVSPVTVAAGAAVVDGKLYESTAAETVAIPTPAALTRIDRIVLRKDFSAQTVRITRIAGAEGGSAPAITQLDATTWDVKLAQVSITTGGAITVTDERVMAHSPIGVPSGSVFYTIKNSVPAGYTEYTAARGRYIVALVAGGTNLGTVGTALSNVQNRAVGQHSHGITDPQHYHGILYREENGGGVAVSMTTIGGTFYTWNSNVASTGITVNNEGSVAGTNAPYIQMMCIKKD